VVNLTIKKVYCSKCQKLRRIKLQQANGKKQFVCMACNHMIWQKENLDWKYNKVG
jgi:hypothetical protein